VTQDISFAADDPDRKIQTGKIDSCTCTLSHRSSLNTSWDPDHVASQLLAGGQHVSARALLSIHVRPCIQKYALAQLGDPERIQETSRGVQLWQMLNREIQLPVAGVVNDYLELQTRPSNELKVVVVTHKPPAPPEGWHGRVVRSLEHTFRDDLCLQVDYMRAKARLPIKRCILFFLDRNGIHAGEDVNYHSVQRMYWIYERRQMHVHVPRRPRVHLGPGLPPYLR